MAKIRHESIICILNQHIEYSSPPSLKRFIQHLSGDFYNHKGIEPNAQSSTQILFNNLQVSLPKQISC